MKESCLPSQQFTVYEFGEEIPAHFQRQGKNFASNRYWRKRVLSDFFQVKKIAPLLA